MTEGASSPGRRAALTQALVLLAGAAGAAYLVLGACAPPTGVAVPEAAPSAGDPACSAALERAPAVLSGRPRAAVDVPGVGAWGDPRVVTLRCGLPALAPTTLPCLEVGGVDWVLDDRSDPVVYTTFGRAPAVEVRADRSLPADAAAAALAELAPLARALPRTGRACVGAGG